MPSDKPMEAQENLEDLRKQYEELTDRHRRIVSSRSWRWAMPIRRIEEFIRRKSPMDSSSGPQTLTNMVAVIIPCHNYGRFLKEAVESVLKQTYLPEEIVIVDDASTDNTPDVASSFSEKGVAYIRGEWHDVSEARNAGAAMTRAKYLLFLDADDFLPPKFLEKCVSVIKNDLGLGFVYPDMSFTGIENKYARIQEFEMDTFERVNFISSHAVVSRLAFDLVGGFRPGIQHEDWDLYRRIVRMTFQAKHAKTHCYYRTHGDSRFVKAMDDPRNTYRVLANLDTQPLTIFTWFSGEVGPDPYLKDLKNLALNPSFIQLHWYSTSRDPVFNQRLEQELTTLPFSKKIFTRAPLTIMTDFVTGNLIKSEIYETSYCDEIRALRAYNTFLTECMTEFAVTFAEDLAPAPNTLHLLFDAMDSQANAVVSPISFPSGGNLQVWEKNHKGIPVYLDQKKKGVTKVSGGGFGFTLFRMRAFGDKPLITKLPLKPVITASPGRFHELAFERLSASGKILCNWDISINRFTE